MVTLNFSIHPVEDNDDNLPTGAGLLAELLGVVTIVLGGLLEDCTGGAELV